MLRRSKSHRGQGLTEYGMLLTVMCVVLVLVLPAISLGWGTINSAIGSTINSAIGGPSGGIPSPTPGGGNPTPTPGGGTPSPTPGGGNPTPAPTPPPIKPGPPPKADITCGPYAPGATVDITFTPESGSPVSVLATTTADSNGMVIAFEVSIPADAYGSYVFGCRVGGHIDPLPPEPGPPPPPPDPPMPTPMPPNPTNPTMWVRVNDCAAAYVRSAPTVRSAAVVLLPAGSGPLLVYTDPLTGGSWGAPPDTLWYTCDGQGDSWYQIASGTYAGDYIFTGGVHDSGSSQLGTLIGTIRVWHDVDGSSGSTSLQVPIGAKVRIERVADIGPAASYLAPEPSSPPTVAVQGQYWWQSRSPTDGYPVVFIWDGDVQAHCAAGLATCDGAVPTRGYLYSEVGYFLSSCQSLTQDNYNACGSNDYLALGNSSTFGIGAAQDNGIWTVGSLPSGMSWTFNVYELAPPPAATATPGTYAGSNS